MPSVRLISALALLSVGITASAIQGSVDTRLLLHSGHLDIAIGPATEDEDAARLFLWIDDPKRPGMREERSPAAGILTVPPAAALTIPANPAFAFLGAPGETAYVLPQNPIEGFLFAGFSTEPLRDTPLSGTANFTTHALSGPGDLILYRVDPFGQPEIIMDTRDPGAFTWTVGERTHVHYAFAFTAPGRYEWTLGATLQTPEGLIEAPPVILHFDIATGWALFPDISVIDDPGIGLSPRFGRVQNPLPPWIWLDGLGFAYAHALHDGTLWLWLPSSATWLATHPDHFPLFYTPTAQEWVVLHRNPPAPPLFFILSSQIRTLSLP